jgi:hypothetical protein
MIGNTYFGQEIEFVTRNTPNVLLSLCEIPFAKGHLTQHISIHVNKPRIAVPSAIILEAALDYLCVIKCHHQTLLVPICAMTPKQISRGKWIHME